MVNVLGANEIAGYDFKMAAEYWNQRDHLGDMDYVTIELDRRPSRDLMTNLHDAGVDLDKPFAIIRYPKGWREVYYETSTHAEYLKVFATNPPETDDTLISSIKDILSTKVNPIGWHFDLQALGPKVDELFRAQVDAAKKQ
ncbi:MAG: hypothetical protein WAV40_04915 [Microgenomates group bacterium]